MNRSDNVVGQRRIGRPPNRLDAVSTDRHDRRVPDPVGNIDHLVIAASAISIIDAKNYTGKVEERDPGGRTRSDLRLYVLNR